MMGIGGGLGAEPEEPSWHRQSRGHSTDVRDQRAGQQRRRREATGIGYAARLLITHDSVSV